MFITGSNKALPTAYTICSEGKPTNVFKSLKLVINDDDVPASRLRSDFMVIIRDAKEHFYKRHRSEDLKCIRDLETIEKEFPTDEVVVDYIFNWPPFDQNIDRLESAIDDGRKITHIVQKLKESISSAIRGIHSGRFLPEANVFLVRNDSRTPTDDDLRLVAASSKLIGESNYAGDFGNTRFANIRWLKDSFGTSTEYYGWITISSNMDTAITRDPECEFTSTFLHEDLHIGFSNMFMREDIEATPDAKMPKGYRDPWAVNRTLYAHMTETDSRLAEPDFALETLPARLLRRKRIETDLERADKIITGLETPESQDNLTSTGKNIVSCLREKHKRIVLSIN